MFPIALHRGRSLAVTAIVTMVGLLSSSPKAAQAQNDVYLLSGTFTTDPNQTYNHIYVGKDSSGNTSDSMGHPYNAVLLDTNQLYNTFIESHNQSGVIVDNNALAADINAYDSSQVIFNSGTANNIAAWNSSQISINGGTILTAQAHDSGILDITGGHVGLPQSLQGGTVNISGGTFDGWLGQSDGTTNFSGGSVGNAQGFDSSINNVRGGTITQIAAWDNTNFFVTGGTFGHLEAHQFGTIQWSGGTGTGPLRMFDSSTLILFGKNLSFSSAGAGQDSYGSYNDYILGGMLNDGSSIDGIHFLDYAGGLTVQDPAHDTGNLQFVTSATAPEPAPLALLILSSVGFLARKRRATPAH